MTTHPHIRLFIIDHSKKDSHFLGMPVELPGGYMTSHGYAPHEVIHQIAHGNRSYRSWDSITSNAVRKLSRARAHHKQNDGRIHLFGMLDHDSPYGNRRIMEHTIRHMARIEHPFVVHMLWYDPTPREYRMAVSEIMSFMPAHGKIGSVSPVHIAHNYNDTKKYFDGIMSGEVTSLPVEIPFQQSAYYTDEAVVHPHDSYIFLNSLNPFDHYQQRLNHELGITIQALDDDVVTPPWLARLLDRRQHVVCVSNRPHYIRSYAGSVAHPYLETWMNDSSEHLLEMLISPHFGYTQDPAHTAVLLDKQNTAQFDWLIDSYIKHHINKDIDVYYVPVGRIAPILLERKDVNTRSIAL
jgi:hypothetical protein